MLLEGAIVSDRADLSPIARILDGSSHLLGTWLSEFYCHSYNSCGKFSSSLRTYYFPELFDLRLPAVYPGDFN